MRNDLLDAQAALDWAVAQIKVLTRRISTWRQSRPYRTVTEPDGQSGYEIVKIEFPMPLPTVINAEAGAIINMIRSSLDILAVALAERNGHVRPKDVYFPIAANCLDFIDPMHGAIEKIKRLSQADRLTIEQLLPYEGGDNCLAALHQLDILRKHQRLVGVSVQARSIHFTRSGSNHPPPEFLYRGTLEHGAPLLRVLSGHTDGHVNVPLEVTFNETKFANRRPVLQTVQAFAARAAEIIALFDH